MRTRDIILAIAGVVILASFFFFQSDKFSRLLTDDQDGQQTITPVLIANQTVPFVGKDDLIKVYNLRSWETVKSPLAIEGEARGYWFFEASFPIRLLDENGKEIAIAIAQAQSDPEGEQAPYGAGWMTEDFVPFKAELTFNKHGTSRGALVFQKDNPSGLPEFDDEFRIPVNFADEDEKKCFATGCSGQICSDEEVITTCEFREEYVCYKTARCERQVDGKCGWTMTPELFSCLESAGIF